MEQHSNGNGQSFPSADQYVKQNAVGVRSHDGLGWVNTNQVVRLMDGYCEVNKKALIKLAQAVAEMRKDQSRYFKNRMSYNLEKAKSSEKIVDAIVAEIITHPEAQTKLF